MSSTDPQGIRDAFTSATSTLPPWKFKIRRHPLGSSAPTTASAQRYPTVPICLYLPTIQPHSKGTTNMLVPIISTLHASANNAPPPTPRMHSPDMFAHPAPHHNWYASPANPCFCAAEVTHQPPTSASTNTRLDNCYFAHPERLFLPSQETSSLTLAHQPSATPVAPPSVYQTLRKRCAATRRTAKPEPTKTAKPAALADTPSTPLGLAGFIEANHRSTAPKRQPHLLTMPKSAVSTLNASA